MEKGKRGVEAEIRLYAVTETPDDEGKHVSQRVERLSIMHKVADMHNPPISRVVTDP